MFKGSNGSAKYSHKVRRISRFQRSADLHLAYPARCAALLHPASSAQLTTSTSQLSVATCASSFKIIAFSLSGSLASLLKYFSRIAQVRLRRVLVVILEKT